MVMPTERPAQQTISPLADMGGRGRAGPLLCCRGLTTIDWEWYLQMLANPGWSRRSRPASTGMGLPVG